jgi:ABC-2 type transport system ATP-binding protein
VLEQAGLAAVARQRIRGFSLGMKQRLGIAAALLGDPSILIFDEPGNGLDPEGIHWIRSLMRTMAGEGRTVFVSSHLMSEMALTADHLLVLGRGRLLADTSMADFLNAHGPGGILVRSSGADDLGALLANRGAAHTIPLSELTTRQASLEQAYLFLTGTSVDFSSGGPATASAHVPAAANGRRSHP